MKLLNLAHGLSFCRVPEISVETWHMNSLRSFRLTAWPLRGTSCWRPGDESLGWNALPGYRIAKKVLTQISNACPEVGGDRCVQSVKDGGRFRMQVAPFLAPLGFAPSPSDREASQIGALGRPGVGVLSDRSPPGKRRRSDWATRPGPVRQV